MVEIAYTLLHTIDIYGEYLTDTNSENRSVRPGNTWHDGPDLSEYEVCDEMTLLDIRR